MGDLMSNNELAALNIEWVEIPAGTFIKGLTVAQRRLLYKELKRRLGGLRQVWWENRLLFRQGQRALGYDVHGKLGEVVESEPVYLERFYISRYPITMIQYTTHQRQIGAVVHYDDQRTIADGWGKLPQMASFYMAQQFCRSHGLRLPTSDEWEKAARGTDGRLYPWGNTWDPTRGNVVRELAQKLPKDRPARGNYTSEVDAYPTGQSVYGVQDLVGNIQEWTSEGRLRRWPIKADDRVAWLFNVLAFEGNIEAGWENTGFYVGFRVVCDQLPE